METRWFKRRWDERRGDALDAWGGATYYFEVEGGGVPTRQIEVYDAGLRLQYGPGREEDAFGQLAQAPFDRDEDWSEWAISSEEFQAGWERGQSILWSAGVPDGGVVVLVGLRGDGLANELARITADGRRQWRVESPASSDGWVRVRLADGYVQAWSWSGWRIDYELSSGRELGRCWTK